MENDAAKSEVGQDGSNKKSRRSSRVGDTPARRKFLQGIAAVGVTTGLLGITEAVSAENYPEKLETTTQYISADVSVPCPDDAIESSGHPDFPISMKGESALYLPNGPIGPFQGVFNRARNAPIVEGPHSIINGRLTKSAGFSGVPTDRGTSLTNAEIDQGLEISPERGAVKLKIGSRNRAVEPGQVVSFSRRSRVSYQSNNGMASTTLPVHVEVENHGDTRIFAHPELVTIPKYHAAGRYIESTLLPAIEEGEKIGTWNAIVDLGDAWGIERSNGVGQ